MSFEEVVDQAVEMLQRRGRLSYGLLQRQFDLDDAALGDLKEELLYAHPQVADDGRGLVWDGQTDAVRESVAPVEVTASKILSQDPKREPLAYTPQHLADKILTSRSALEGERKQVTVLFVDIANSTPLGLWCINRSYPSGKLRTA